MNFNNQEMEQLLEEALQQVMGEEYPQILSNLQTTGSNIRMVVRDNSNNSIPNFLNNVQIPPIIQNIANTVEERLQESINQRHNETQTEQSLEEETLYQEPEQDQEQDQDQDQEQDQDQDQEPEAEQDRTQEGQVQEPVNETIGDQPPSTQPMSQQRNHHIDVLNDFLQSYHDNFRLYQQNTTMALRQLQSITRQQQQTTTSRTRSTSNPQQSRTNISSWFQPLLSDMGIEVGGIISPNASGIGTGPFSGVFPGMGNTVHSIPTIRQFACATEPLRYDTSFHSVSRACPITLEDFQDGEFICRIKQCRHIFKVQPLQNWFSRNSYCPVCRYDIRTWVEPQPAVSTTDISNNVTV